MSKKPETLFKEKVLADLQGFGFVEKIQQVSKIGTPDILACIGGRFVAIELKKDALAHIDKIQLLKLLEIKKYGGIALITYPENWAKDLAALKKLSLG